jgi:hypothetical protein
LTLIYYWLKQYDKRNKTTTKTYQYSKAQQLASWTSVQEVTGSNPGMPINCHGFVPLSLKAFNQLSLVLNASGVDTSKKNYFNITPV